MKLWLLRPAENLPKENNPWGPWYDKAFGFVVRAETEAEASKLAQSAGGDESWAGALYSPVWMSNKFSTCVELSPDGDTEIIIRDFAKA